MAKKKKILTPLEWIKDVQGKDEVEHLSEDYMEFIHVLRMMARYGRYVKTKMIEK